MELHTTPLYDEHIKLGAHMVDFHGVMMPLEYEGIVKEHNFVRENCGVFDVSHMGEFLVTGKGAFAFIQYLITNDLSKSYPGKALYSPMCNDQGGIVDDVVVYCVAEEEYLFVVNSANKEKDYSWLENKIADFDDVELSDISDTLALIAVQGPKAVKTVASLMPGDDISSIGRYTLKKCDFRGKEVISSRTGYTGEDGFELFIDVDGAVELWKALVSCDDVMPIGLGARDTLRLEACYSLYGNELTDDTTPLEAALSWTVSFDKGDFCGKSVLDKQEKEGLKTKLIAYELIDKGIGRAGYSILDGDGKKIGYVTSGTHSPFLHKSIGLGYVESKFAKMDSDVFIEIRNRKGKAKIVERPFYRSESIMPKKEGSSK